MRKISLSQISLPLLLLFVVAACSATDPAEIPTLVVLPSATLEPATALPTDTPEPTLTPTTEALVAAAPTELLSPTAEPATLTPVPSPEDSDTANPTLPPSPTPSPTHSVTPTATPTATNTPNVRPSLTITNTITPTPSPSYTPTQELGLLGELAALSQRATILPPEMLYNPPTLTALYMLGQSAPATLSAATSAALLPTVPVDVMTCAVQPPLILANALATDPALASQVGCAQLAAPFPTVTAIQSFERGSMLFVAGPPNYIYVITFDGRFLRFDDTWTAGIDPESGGETPPLGLIEPKRGFGKVWRTFPDVRALLGWAINEEVGGTASVLPFERGRAIALPQRNETFMLIDDPGGQTGTWRSAAIMF